jgi:hypothetical protein
MDASTRPASERVCEKTPRLARTKREILFRHGNSVLTEHHLRRPRAPWCAVFVMARPRVICRGHRDESIHCPASARVIETRARMASATATSPLSIAHVLLRYCAIAKLIANGSPYFVLYSYEGTMKRG